jgi:uncharacterized protein YmfQ (DUF2313 family)
MPIIALWPLPPSAVPSPPAAAVAGTGARGEADYLAALQALLPRGRAWSRDPSATLTAVLDGWARGYARHDARAANLLEDAFPPDTVELLPEWEATLGLPDPCLGGAIGGPAATLQQREAQVVARLLALGGQAVPYLTALAAQLGFPVAIVEFAPFRAGISHAGDAVNGSQAATGSLYFAAGSNNSSSGGVAGQQLVVWDGGQGFDWAFALQITATVEPTQYFRAGIDAAGEPIASWYGSQALAQIQYFSAGPPIGAIGPGATTAAVAIAAPSHAGEPIARWGAPLLECELRRVIPAHATVIFAYGA